MTLAHSRPALRPKRTGSAARGPVLADQDRDLLLELADAFQDSTRHGAPYDVPEGARYIQISDTLAQNITRDLRRIAQGGKP